MKNVSKEGPCVWWHTPPRFLTPNPFDDYETFCVVREPFDRLLSEFKMHAKMQINSTKAANTYMKKIVEHTKHLENPVFVSRECHFWPQHFYVWDRAGKCTCRHVLRYETLETDFNKLMIRFGIDLRFTDAHYTLLHHDATNLTVDDLPSDTASRVRQIYDADTRLFGYANLSSSSTSSNLGQDGDCIDLKHPLPRAVRQGSFENITHWRRRLALRAYHSLFPPSSSS